MSTGPTQAEYSALISFYQNTNGASWLNKTGWATADPYVIEDVGSWHGVTVNGNGNVIRIDLRSNGLSGFIQQNISALEHLELLDLSDNNIGGAIPGSVTYLSNLEYLNLANNNFNSPIPSQVGNMTGLKYLYLSNNPLGGSIPANLANLTNLLHLDLTHTRLSGPIPLGSPNFQPNYIMVGRNGFTFADLLPVKDMIAAASGYYSPQDSVDIGKSIMVPSGQTGADG